MADLRNALARQAEIVAKITAYFAAENVLPVDTRLLRDHGVTDPAVNNMLVSDEAGDALGYLQFSPEFAMKILLAHGSGDIYQLCRAFRGGESGRLHRSEFRILEWYRLGFDHHRLMDDVQALLAPLIPDRCWDRVSYRELFLAQIGFEPHLASNEQLFAQAQMSLSLESRDVHDRSLLFDIIFSHQIQPKLTSGQALFIFDFPKEQAAYALLRDEDPQVASRFELLVDGVELANGYHELTDPKEQLHRHEVERTRRARAGQEDVSFDPEFIAALERGMPNCAGVALGVDRLLMIILGADSLLAAEMR